ncbi:Rne/Rng family ribonuclease, partial [Streptantibioticus rubrisoli]
MLDTPEPDNAAPEAPNGSDSGVSAESATPAAPRRRRRAASRPAGPPAAASAEDNQIVPEKPTAPEAPAAEPVEAAAPARTATTRRRASRKATAPAGPPKSAEEAPEPASEEQPAAAGAEEAPARTPRRRATRKSAAAEPQAAPQEGQAEEAPRARRTRKRAAEQTADESRRLKPGALAPKEEEPEPEQAPVEAAAEPEAAPQRTRRRSRKATAEAGPPSFATADSEAAEPVASMAPEEDVAEEPVRGRRRAVRPPTAVFQPPVFVAPEAAAAAEEGEEPRRRRRRRVSAEEAQATAAAEEPTATEEPAEEAEPEAEHEEEAGERPSRRRRRGGRRRRRGEAAEAEAEVEEETETEADQPHAEEEPEAEAEAEEAEHGTSTSRRRRRRRRRSGEAPGEAEPAAEEDGVRTVVKIREPRKKKEEQPSDEVQSIKGSTRLEAKKQRRREGREQGRRRVPIITEAEFLARREAVERVMVVRESGERTQIGVLEDGVLVEHFVNKEQATSYVGNVYLGKVQNVLPSMEAAFVDIGKGRNAVLYAGEVNFEALGLAGGPRRIESALKSGQSVLVQVTKDPIGHKGARLTSQVSLPGRYLVYVPEGSMTGISRKLPDTERARLKQILKKIVPEDAGVIVRTAAEGASEEELRRDVERLQAQWEEIQKKAKNGNAPTLLYGEPDMTVRVVRDIFNEDFSKVIISGDNAWETIHGYVSHVAPDLVDRLQKWSSEVDAFATYRIDEQLLKALDRKVWLPSGGSLVIDRTEAMVVIDVNTGKFTGQGGNLEETVTRNNLEAAEEIVRQLRLRDLGGIIVIDFIDMVLESNRDLVMRRLLECLGRDRTKHQVAEVTSLGLIQMTRKRVGQGLLESFSETCVHCNGRGVIVHMEQATVPGGGGKRKKKGRAAAQPEAVEAAPAAEVVEPVEVTERELVPAIGGDEEWFGSPAEAEAAAKAAPRGRRRATRAASAPAGAPKQAEPEVVVAAAPVVTEPEPEVAAESEVAAEPEPVRPRRRSRKATAPAGSPKVAAEEAAAGEVIVVPAAPVTAEAEPEVAAEPEAAPVEVEAVRPPRRARKASAPAGPPPSAGEAAVVVVPAAPVAEGAEGAEAVEAVEEEAAPKKRAARKTAAKKAPAKKTAAKKATAAKKSTT